MGATCQSGSDLNHHGLVYFLHAPLAHRIKIGWTADPSPLRRLKAALKLLPIDVFVLAHVPGTFSNEQALHSKHHAARYRGEWFDETAALWADVEAARQGTLRFPRIPLQIQVAAPDRDAHDLVCWAVSRRFSSKEIASGTGMQEATAYRVSRGSRDVNKNTIAKLAVWRERLQSAFSEAA